MRFSVALIALCCAPLLLALPLSHLRVERAPQVVLPNAKRSTRKVTVGVQWGNDSVIAVDVYEPEPHPISAVIEVLEKRGVISAAAQVIGKVVTLAIDAIKKRIEKGKEKRNEFVKHILDGLTQRPDGSKPDRNFLVHLIRDKNPFVFKPEGEKGKDWDQVCDDMHIGKYVYRVLSFKVADFFNPGDGGYLNWGYWGSCKQNPENHNNVHCTDPTK